MRPRLFPLEDNALSETFVPGEDSQKGAGHVMWSFKAPAFVFASRRTRDARLVGTFQRDAIPGGRTNRAIDGLPGRRGPPLCSTYPGKPGWTFCSGQ